ncbi:biliverdin reductase A-like [Littorina saxatilis]|uniref:Gfo/Idh/MocA-like oxidoreductase N-terminal domain-containing protein n=1 Tax=Littorina saxatilis TaxID=31220 RepID=A0AAN9BL11_9CAEN
MAATRSVVGVVVVGVGIAGRVRIRDLQECTCGLELKGFVSRRELEVPGVQQLTFKDALTSTDVKGIIVCTEPVWHEEFIRQALENGKHVLVEYPVALTSSATRDLYTQAANKGLVLHEENIGLLTESHQKLKELAATKTLKTGTNSLVGNYNGWVEKLPLEGKPFLSNIAAIQSFYDVFGDLKAVGATLDIHDTGVKFCGEFEPKTGNQKLFIKGERYKERVQRAGSTIVEFEDGEIFDSTTVKSAALPGPKKPGLFMQDLEIFAAKVNGERTTEADEITRCVRSIEIAEEAHKFLE